VLETAMGTATTTSTPASQVDDLIKQVHTCQLAAPTYCLGWLTGPSVETVRCDVLFTPAWLIDFCVVAACWCIASFPFRIILCNFVDRLSRWLNEHLRLKDTVKCTGITYSYISELIWCMIQGRVSWLLILWEEYQILILPGSVDERRLKLINKCMVRIIYNSAQHTAHLAL
jgi:hypothetical protein